MVCHGVAQAAGDHRSIIGAGEARVQHGEVRVDSVPNGRSAADGIDVVHARRAVPARHEQRARFPPEHQAADSVVGWIPDLHAQRRGRRRHLRSRDETHVPRNCPETSSASPKVPFATAFSSQKTDDAQCVSTPQKKRRRFSSVVAIESQLFVLSTGIDDPRKKRGPKRRSFLHCHWSVADVGLPGGVRESRWRPSTAWRR